MCIINYAIFHIIALHAITITLQTFQSYVGSKNSDIGLRGQVITEKFSRQITTHFAFRSKKVNFRNS